MSGVSRPTLNLGGPQWARRTLSGILWVVISVLGITTLNGTAASGFTHVPNVFKQLFNFLGKPPAPPKGYTALTPNQIQQDVASSKDKYLGQKVAVVGRVLPWTDEDITKFDSKNEGALGIKGMKPRAGTFKVAMYADPEEHPELYGRAVPVTIRVSPKWLSDHTAVQDQWVQVWGTEVVFSPGGGQAEGEIQMDDFEIIQEPFDIYDHTIPITKPGAED